MTQQTENLFVGLAPFLRLSTAGHDLRPIAQDLLAQANEQQDNADLWMNLATAFYSIGQREVGMSIQQQALEMKRTYHLPASRQPAKLRVLTLMAAGDLTENIPIDCLLEDSEDIDLIFYYATADAPLPAQVPDHDVVLTAISYAEGNVPILKALEPLLAAWSKPVINPPQYIPNVERSLASELLHGVPGLSIPRTFEVSREFLAAVTQAAAVDVKMPGDCGFPMIIRPLGSHAGNDLEKIDSAEQLAAYLDRVNEPMFYVSRFIDYSDDDGQFRKYRIALIAGQPFACHMGISTHWMIHYINAGMYENADKREEEHIFMRDFDSFAHKHQAALEGIFHRSGLEYVCIDCAETKDGELLIFEIDHAMVIHAMDPAELFPYKQEYMLKARRACEDFLFAKAGLAPIVDRG
jgi:glutathione synthase/RimK-type ligase-like ATP-grasp enzyme